MQKGIRMTHKRIGFACKWLNSTSESKDKKIRAAEREVNTSGTTVAWLNRQTVAAAEDKMWEVARHNLRSVKNVLARVATLDKRLHMMRIGSDLLPMYTEAKWGYFWQQPDVKAFCEREFADIGAFARQHDIRLSFHPGQFCVLASQDDDIVRRSIEEFEYHADMARMMGYGAAWHDHGFKINVHISGAQGPAGVLRAMQRMTPEARNLITIENEEMKWGLEDCLQLEKEVALVLDIHHHLVKTGGEYIQPDDNRWRRVIDSWRGVRPTMHYSLSREDVLVGHCPNTLPDIKTLLETKAVNKTKVRAHSDDAWNSALNSWALGFWPDADIMLEAKWKNMAAARLLEHA
jgi:UV DNA damage repair endonuclease